VPFLSFYNFTVTDKPFTSVAIKEKVGSAFPSLSENVHDDKLKGRRWYRERKSSPRPQFYLTEDEKRDGETSKIHRWLELADRLFDSDDIDPTPSAA